MRAAAAVALLVIPVHLGLVLAGVPGFVALGADAVVMAAAAAVSLGDQP